MQLDSLCLLSFYARVARRMSVSLAASCFAVHCNISTIYVTLTVTVPLRARAVVCSVSLKFCGSSTSNWNEYFKYALACSIAAKEDQPGGLLSLRVRTVDAVGLSNAQI
jgi:hypothetical protein